MRESGGPRGSLLFLGFRVFRVSAFRGRRAPPADEDEGPSCRGLTPSGSRWGKGGKGGAGRGSFLGGLPDGPRVTFETLPVVHLERRRLPEYPGTDPEAAFTHLARRFGRVVLVDVTGVRTNDADLEFLQAASRRRSVWVDAGSRFATDAMDLFVAGAEAVTMRWNTLDSAAELEEAGGMAQPGSLFLGLEFPRGQFLRNPRDARDAHAVAALAREHQIGLVYLVDRADEGFLRGLPESGTLRYVQGAPPGAASTLQSMGYSGMLLAPAQLPPEAKP